MSCVRHLQGLGPLIVCALLVACGDNNSPSNVTAPGGDTKAKTRILQTGTALLQGKQPLEALNVYMDGFHLYNGDMKGRWRLITTARW